MGVVWCDVMDGDLEGQKVETGGWRAWDFWGRQIDRSIPVLPLLDKSLEF